MPETSSTVLETEVRVGDIQLELKQPNQIQHRQREALKQLCTHNNQPLPESFYMFHFTPDNALNADALSQVLGEPVVLNSRDVLNNSISFWDSLLQLADRKQELDQSKLIFGNPSQQFAQFVEKILSKEDSSALGFGNSLELNGQKYMLTSVEGLIGFVEKNRKEIENYLDKSLYPLLSKLLDRRSPRDNI